MQPTALPHLQHGARVTKVQESHSGTPTWGTLQGEEGQGRVMPWSQAQLPPAPTCDGAGPGQGPWQAGAPSTHKELLSPHSWWPRQELCIYSPNKLHVEK